MEDYILKKCIDFDKTIVDALKLMDIEDTKLLMVIKENLFYGLLSIGDIQRAIIKNMPLDTLIQNILRKEFKIATENTSLVEIKDMMLEHRMEFCPVINDKNVIEKIYTWNYFYGEKFIPKNKFNVPVVIMAGGLGSRLRPITNVLPKPLIPIGNKTMLEHIFDRFNKYGCDNFFISVNYKFELIKFYLDSLKLDFHISYFKENKPLGTAGSLSMLKGKIKGAFFVNNCDILIEDDYSSMLEYHCMNKNEITIISAIKNISIPYGTIKSSTDGILEELIEKPDFTFMINSGMYILESELLDEIPSNEFLHITHLIEKVKKRGGRIGVYPVSEKSWRDIGEWKEYLKNYGEEI